MEIITKVHTKKTSKMGMEFIIGEMDLYTKETLRMTSNMVKVQSHMKMAK